MKILLADLNAKVGRGDIFKLTVGNKSLHELSNYNRVRLVNVATYKHLTVRERLAVNKQRSHRFHTKRFILKKLNKVEDNEKCHVEVSIGFAALDDLDTEVEIIVLRKRLERI
jgi:hypothetical protein